jgi:GntR family transcriptional regulator
MPAPSDMLPLYFQVEQTLRSEIEAGHFAPGDLLPTEAQLCGRFGVSRITIGKALTTLERDFLIVRRQGVGTFVADIRKPGKSVTLVASLDEMLAPARDVSKKLLDRRAVKAPKAIAVALSLASNAKVYCFEALFSSGEDPYAFSRQYVPLAIGEALVEKSIEVPDIPSIEAVALARVERARQFIKPVAADATCAKHLGLKQRSPILEVTRTFYRVNDLPLNTSIVFFHPDRYRYEVELMARGVR